MQLFRTIVNIDEQQIVKQQILDKIIFIKTLLVSYQKILDLKCCHPSNHMNIVTIAVCQKHILQLMLIKHLKKLASTHHLTVCR